MPLTPEQKKQAQAIIQLYENNPEKLNNFKNKLKTTLGATEMDLPELATSPATQPNVFESVGKAITDTPILQAGKSVPGQIMDAFQGVSAFGERAMDSAARGVGKGLTGLDVPRRPLRNDMLTQGSQAKPSEPITIAGIDPVYTAGQIGGAAIGYATTGLLHPILTATAAIIQKAAQGKELTTGELLGIAATEAAGIVLDKYGKIPNFLRSRIDALKNSSTVKAMAEKIFGEMNAPSPSTVATSQQLQKTTPSLNVPMDARPYQQTLDNLLGVSQQQQVSMTPLAPRQLPETAGSLNQVRTAPGKTWDDPTYLTPQDKQPKKATQPRTQKFEKSKETVALIRIQQKVKPKKEVRKPAEPPKQKTVSANSLNVGDQYVSSDRRLMEVLEKSSAPKKAASKRKSDYDLVVRDVQTGKKSKLNRTKEVSKISDIQFGNLDYLFGEK